MLALVGEPRPALFVRMPAVVQDTGGTHDRTLWWKLELDDALERHWRLVDAYARPELATTCATGPEACGRGDAGIPLACEASSGLR